MKTLNITINSFDSLSQHKSDGRAVEVPLEIWYDNVEIRNLTPMREIPGREGFFNFHMTHAHGYIKKHEEESHPEGPFFAHGTHSLFLYPYDHEPNPIGKGYKIVLPYEDSSHDPDEATYRMQVERMIAVQNILSTRGVTFKCEEDPIYVTIGAKDSSKVMNTYGMVTETSFTWDSRMDVHKIKSCLELRKGRTDIMAAMRETGVIIRSRGRRIIPWVANHKILRKETSEVKNWIRTSDGTLKYIDVDPSYYIAKKTKKMKKELKESIQKVTPFRFRPGTKKQNRHKLYQSVSEEGMEGLRDMNKRWDLMGFTDHMFTNKRVLDIGSNLGRMCVRAAELSANECVGLELDEVTCDVSREYIASLKQKPFGSSSIADTITIHQFNVSDGLEALKDVIGDEQFDVIFGLAIVGYIKPQKNFWDIINYYTKETFYFEHHARWTEEKTLKVLEDNTNFSNHEYLGAIADNCGSGPRPNFRSTV